VEPIAVPDPPIIIQDMSIEELPPPVIGIGKYLNVF